MSNALTKPSIILYTDGACSGNPGPGGWGCVVIYQGNTHHMSGYDQQTTNNKMELMAVIKGLESLNEPSNVTIFTDSTYVKNAFTERWLSSWVKRGWKTSQGQAVKNQDLWQILLTLQNKHTLSWQWVKGHSGDHYNELCDGLARQAIKEKAGQNYQRPMEKNNGAKQWTNEANNGLTTMP